MISASRYIGKDTMTGKYKEKRSYLRIYVKCEIRLIKSAERTEINSYVDAVIRDLSAEGVGIVFERKLAPGDAVDIKFKFAKERTLKLKGEIKRCDQLAVEGSSSKQYSIGIKFVDSPQNIAPIFLKIFRTGVNVTFLLSDSDASANSKNID